MEPSGPHLPGRPAASRRVLIPGGAVFNLPLLPASVRVAAAAGATALALTSAGDALLLAALLAVVVADPLVSAIPLLAAVAVIARIGTSSMPALAGAQSVLGPAALTGSARLALSAATAAVALVFCPRDDLAAVPFGLTAAALAFGPASDGAGHLALRATASVGAVALCAFIHRRLDSPITMALAAGTIGLSVVLALPGHWSIAGLGGADRWLVGGTRAVAAAALALVAAATWRGYAPAGWARPAVGAHRAQRTRSPGHVKSGHQPS